MTKVRFFAIAGNANNEEIARKLQSIAYLQTEIYACPKEIASVQPMPFLQVEGGERFYGEEAIEVFLSEKAAVSS